MPRYADHDERKDELADSVVELILEHGIDHVSVRNVAQKSGWSVGAIRYYFPKQEDLLIYALNRTTETAYNRVLSAEMASADSSMERTSNVIRALIPVNDTNRNTLRIWTAFLDMGLSNPEIVQLMNRVWQNSRFFSRRIIASLAGLPAPEERDELLQDPFMEETAAVLHVMWDGMCLQGLMSPKMMSPESLEIVMSRVLNAISDRVQSHIDGNQLAV